MKYNFLTVQARNMRCFYHCVGHVRSYATYLVIANYYSATIGNYALMIFKISVFRGHDFDLI